MKAAVSHAARELALKASRTVRHGAMDAAFSVAVATAEAAASVIPQVSNKAEMGTRGSEWEEKASGVASWIEEQRQSYRETAAARSREERLTPFREELEVLRISTEQLGQLDETTLRHAYRARSREMHPDLHGQGGQSRSAKHRPSIYEINRAYSVLRKLL